MTSGQRILSRTRQLLQPRCCRAPALPKFRPAPASALRPKGEHMRRWRRGSEFGDGPRVPLDREQRAVFRARLTMKAFRRIGALTITAVRVAEIMLGMQGRDGRLDPSIETLAVRAGVDASTVVRALARLRGCGFVTWVRRLVRDGARVEQTSNAYVLTVPGSPDLRFAQAAKPVVFSRVERPSSDSRGSGKRRATARPPGLRRAGSTNAGVERPKRLRRNGPRTPDSRDWTRRHLDESLSVARSPPGWRPCGMASDLRRIAKL